MIIKLIQLNTTDTINTIKIMKYNNNPDNDTMIVKIL